MHWHLKASKGEISSLVSEYLHSTLLASTSVCSTKVESEQLDTTTLKATNVTAASIVADELSVVRYDCGEALLALSQQSTLTVPKQNFKVSVLCPAQVTSQSFFVHGLDTTAGAAANVGYVCLTCL